MKYIAPLIALALAFCLTEVTLIYFLPLAKTDHDVWLQYFLAKDGVYDAMFFLFSLVLFWVFKETKKMWPAMVSAFLVVVTGGSFIDKVIFSLNQYLLSDVALIAMGVLVAINIYRKWKT
jgi:ABC-type transport system involved in multi-copper enzyme maturation permease subunit